MTVIYCEHFGDTAKICLENFKFVDEYLLRVLLFLPVLQNIPSPGHHSLLASKYAAESKHVTAGLLLESEAGF